MYAEGTNKTYRLANFDTQNNEEGTSSTSHPLSAGAGALDRPLIVQFCANDPQQLLAAAKLVEPHCDAIDINFGCPQDIARRGRYGCFLQDDWELVYDLSESIYLLFDALSNRSISDWVNWDVSQYPAHKPRHPRHREIPRLSRRAKDGRVCEDDGARRCADLELSRPDTRTARAKQRAAVFTSVTLSFADSHI